MINAKPDHCEESNLLVPTLPCNKPATRIIKTRDPQPYRMCEMCAYHNVKNRGANDLGAYDAGTYRQLLQALGCRRVAES